jgi:trimeric autotransporter adhesin
MRKLFFLFLLIVGANKMVQAQAQILWNFGTTAVSGTAVGNPTLPPNITATALSASTQVQNSTTSVLFLTTPALASPSNIAGASGTFCGNAFAKAAPLVTTTSTYLQFILTPAANNWVNITGISWANLSVATGPTSFTLYSSIDNYATPIGTATTTIGTTNWSLITPSINTLTGAVGTAVTIRIYGHGGTGTVSATIPNWRVDDIKITATAQTSSSTVGQIPKYTGATTFTNSIITENNGKIGIGTTVPSSTLEVNGTTTTQGFKMPIGAAATRVLTSDANGVGTWQAAPSSGGTGTVTSASVVSTNGFTGTVATPTTTPAITIGTSVNGLIKGNGTAMSAAIAGTDYLTPTGSAAGLTGFPTLNQNTTGSAATITGAIAQSQVTNLSTDLAAKQNNIILTTSGSTGVATLTGSTLNIPNYASGITNSAWGLSGNSGTTASNFIGTTDAKNLVFKANNTQSGIIDISKGNTSFGENALLPTNTGNGHTAVGTGALRLLASGYSNTAIGSLSLKSATGGTGNTAIGTNAFQTMIGGTSNTAIGLDADVLDGGTWLTNATVIGAGARVATSNSLVLGNNANVGIGTSSPTKKLHLYGTNPSLFIEGDVNSYYPELRIKSQIGEGFVDNYGPASYATGMFLNTKSIQNALVGIGAAKTGNVAYTNDPTLVSFRVISTPNQTNDIFKVIQNTATTLGFFTEANALVVNKDGKVLLGDMTGIDLNPTTFTHKLAVNGSAIFTKAVVRLTNTWPDFVFEKNYKLPTLAEVEAYIAKHKHLKDVPSAEEVKEKGIDLGDNQTILLKKVEELTLYMIELNKKVEALAKENEELKKKVNVDK